MFALLTGCDAVRNGTGHFDFDSQIVIAVDVIEKSGDDNFKHVFLWMYTRGLKAVTVVNITT